MSRDFEASNSESIWVGSPSEVRITGHEVTLSCWVKLESTAAAMALIARWNDGPSGIADRQSYVLSIAGSGNNKVEISARDSGLLTKTGATSLSTGVWYHVCGTISASASKVYLNGTIDGIPGLGLAGTLQDHANCELSLGAQSPGGAPTHCYDGLLAHCAIWAKELTATEVADLAAGVDPATIQPSDLRGYWPLTSGTSPEPDVANGNDGLLVQSYTLAANQPGNAGFETPGVGSGISYQPSSASWTWGLGSGVTGNGSAFSAPNAPQGTQKGFIQGGTDGNIAQSVSYSEGGDYFVRFYCAFRPGNTVEFDVTLGTLTHHYFPTSSSGYDRYITPVVSLSAASHTLTFNQTHSGDNTAFLDVVEIFWVDPGATQLPAYSSDEPYSPAVGDDGADGPDGAAGVVVRYNVYLGVYE